MDTICDWCNEKTERDEEGFCPNCGNRNEVLHDSGEVAQLLDDLATSNESLFGTMVNSRNKKTGDFGKPKRDKWHKIHLSRRVDIYHLIKGMCRFCEFENGINGKMEVQRVLETLLRQYEED